MRDFRECRERAQALMKNSSGQLKEAKDALAMAQAAEVKAGQQALSAAGKAAAVGGAGMLSLQSQALSTPSGAAPRAADAKGQQDVKPVIDVTPSVGAVQVEDATVHKRRRTADLLSELDSVSRDV